MVVGARRDALASVSQAGADLVCIDLEDTVEDKVAARALAQDFLLSWTHTRRAIRINPLSTKEGLEDILLIESSPHKPDVVKMPKLLDPAEIKIYSAILPDIPVIPIIETPDSLERVFEIARSDGPIAGLILGGKDLSEATGASRSWEGLRYARGRIIQAGAAAGIPVYDEPYRPLDDLDGLRELCSRVKELGFSGKTAVDPHHIEVINRAFSET